MLILDFHQESGLLLRSHKQIGPPHSFKNHVGIPAGRMRSSQEICAYHFQTISARPIRAEHESRSVNRFLNDRNLAFVELEINYVRRFGVFARKMFFDLMSELLSRHGVCIVQPSLAIKAITI